MFKLHLIMPINLIINDSTIITIIVNSYSAKWRWMVVDIYQAAKWCCWYPPLSLTQVNNFFSVYHTDAKQLVYFFQYTKRWSEIKLLTRNFVSSAAQRWIVLAIHFQTNESVGMKKHYSLEWFLLIMKVIGKEEWW